MKKIQSVFLPALVAGIASVLMSSVASADSVFVSNNGDNSISEIAADGTVTTFIAPTSDLGGPTGLAFNSAGDLFVANNGLGTIAEFSSTGLFIGNYATGLQNPRGIAFDSSGNLFVADQTSGRITEIPVGTSLGTDFTNSFIADNLNYPNGLSFDSAGNLYVASGGNNSIDKITFSGGNVSTIAPFVTGLNNPNGLATEGSIIVEMDNGSNTIRVFDSSGTPLGTMSAGNNSKGLAIDSQGDLFVTNEGDGTVTKFDPSGNFLASYSGFDGPNYITTLSVPEPSTYALLTAGLGVLFFLARRRKVAAAKI